jgi:hypothetical protein
MSYGRIKTEVRLPKRLPGNVTSSLYQQFAHRARGYRYLDEHLATRTRFFAAAALTNSVLAELCAHPARWLWISCDSIVALAALGGMLERANLERARHIGCEMRSSMSLDCSLIEMEQTLVDELQNNSVITRSVTLRPFSQHRAKVEATPERLKNVKAPPGFAVNVFARDLKNIRIIAVSPNGTVYVTRRDQGDVLMLKDANADGVADGAPVKVASRSGTHGIAIHDGKEYIATVKEVFVADIQSDGTFGPLRICRHRRA